MLDVLGIQANELEEVWYVLDDGDNRLTIKDGSFYVKVIRIDTGLMPAFIVSLHYSLVLL